MLRTTEDNIALLSRAILNEAQEEADQILIEAKENADAIRLRGQEQAEREHTKILERARQTAERIRSQAIAAAQLQARTMQLETREKQLDRVFAAAKQQVQSVQQRSDYGQIVKSLLHDGLVQMKATKVDIRADANTMKYLTNDLLDAISKELRVQIKVGKPLEHGLGIIVDSDNGRIHYDSTFENRLTQMQSSLRAPVHHLLMGEQL
jgi:V/A-type H+-transporting ATPase subunit E